MTKKNNVENTHQNHRARMRARYEKSGFEGFSDHELLEMALFYSIPRINTNPIAHALIEHFGSLGHVLEADVDELTEVEGIGNSSAILLKTVVELMRRYAFEKDDLGDRFETMGVIAQYFCRRFIGENNEGVYMMLLDNGMRLIDCCLVARGTVNSSPVCCRNILDKAMKKKASSVVLAHNHPHGLAIPSDTDIRFTNDVKTVLETLNITLLEHLIIVNDRFCPIMKQHCGTYRCPPGSQKIDSGFYDQFYDVDAETWTAPKIF